MYSFGQSAADPSRRTGYDSKLQGRCESFKSEVVLSGFFTATLDSFLLKKKTRLEQLNGLSASIISRGHGADERLAFVYPSPSSELKSGVKNLSSARLETRVCATGRCCQHLLRFSLQPACAGTWGQTGRHQLSLRAPRWRP